MGTPRADPQRTRPLALTRAPHGGVERIGHGSGTRTDQGEQVVAVGEAEQGGDGVMVLAAEPIPRPPRHHMQGVPHVQ